eukprot:361323-Chlamydomonas_euryale.AAC.1
MLTGPSGQDGDAPLSYWVGVFNGAAVVDPDGGKVQVRVRWTSADAADGGGGGGGESAAVVAPPLCPADCSGRGKCQLPKSGSGWECLCNVGYAG